MVRRRPFLPTRPAAVDALAEPLDDARAFHQGWLVELFGDCGLDLVEMVLADEECWDRYVAAQWFNVRTWLDANPDDVLAGAISADHGEVINGLDPTRDTGEQRGGAGGGLGQQHGVADALRRDLLLEMLR